jgi:hypothetical protein
MKKILVLAICILFAFTGVMKADASEILTLGGSFSSVPSIVNGVAKTEGGGSIDVSYLNGSQLSYVYCVDLFRDVNVPGTYNQTDVNHSGLIYGNLLNNAGKVAWLLDHYGVAGQGDAAIALQAAIWNVIYGYNTYHLDPSASQIGLYNSYLTALDGNTAAVSDILWITPGRLNEAGGLVQYQGLITRVPEPMTMLLLGLGLVGLAGLRRKE